MTNKERTGNVNFLIEKNLFLVKGLLRERKRERIPNPK